MNSTHLLKDFAFFVNEKIPASTLNATNYIGVDNLLPDREGVVPSDYFSGKGKVTKFKKGDILIGNIRPYFKKIWLATFNGGCDADVLCVRSKGIISSAFLYAVLSTDYFFDYVVRGAKGSRMPRGDKNAIMNFPIFNVENKTRIGNFIVSINTKIANNNAISKKLESMAKTIYDYWFLQFEFPDKDGKPYKSNSGKMVWNDQLKQNIPEGWKVKDINELCKIVDCLHSKKPNYKYESVSSYLLTLENIGKYHLVDNSKKYYISSQDYKKWTSRIEVHEGDFVVTNAGRAGDIARVPAGIKSAIGRNLTAIRPEKISSYYLTMFFRSIYMKKQILSNLDLGSFFKSYNVKSIKKIRILVPDDNTMNIFLKICVPLLKKIEILMKENHKLKSLRDFLLPMLMNGQVTITN